MNQTALFLAALIGALAVLQPAVEAQQQNGDWGQLMQCYSILQRHPQMMQYVSSLVGGGGMGALQNTADVT